MANENISLSYSSFSVDLSICVFLYMGQLDKQSQILGADNIGNANSNEGLVSKFYKVTIAKRSFPADVPISASSSIVLRSNNEKLISF